MLQDGLVQSKARVVEAEQQNRIRLEEVETQARLQTDQARRAAYGPEAVAWSAVVVLLILTYFGTGSWSSLATIFILGLIAGALLYGDHPVVAGFFAFIAVVASIALGIESSLVTTRTGGAVLSEYWWLNILLFIGLFAAVLAGFYAARVGRDKVVRVTAAVNVQRAQAAAANQALQTQVAQQQLNIETQVGQLQYVIPLWRAGGPDAERAAQILVNAGMTEEAGLIRNHQRKLSQLRYLDQQVTNRAELLRELQAAAQAATRCPRCGAPQTNVPARAGDAIRCDYCSLVYRPFDVSQFHHDFELRVERPPAA